MVGEKPDEKATGAIADVASRLVSEVERAVVGKRESVELAVIALLSGGHLLIEDIPGVGKTTLAKALARAIGGEFRRIQFTPDLLPADVTGTSIFDQKEAEFRYRPGPIFANVVLADEINRATPKTQSALLEAMEEAQVSSDGETRALPQPFFVVATQNSVEMTGTYPLPEAQLDRFFARISIGYPDRDAERAMLAAQQMGAPIDEIRSVVSLEEVLATQRMVREVFVRDTIRDYVLDVVRATRAGSQFIVGASPRSTLGLMRGAQAHAAVRGSDHVRPDDVKAVAPAILGHRVMPRGDARARGASVEDAIRDLLGSVPAPVPTR
ncbi:MoxR family ATPase [bacterium]|nr:MAG: MoxR family ATPase [bacterium]